MHLLSSRHLLATSLSLSLTRFPLILAQSGDEAATDAPVAATDAPVAVEDIDWPDDGSGTSSHHEQAYAALFAVSIAHVLALFA